jgi:CHAD domain-containing protein
MTDPIKSPTPNETPGVFLHDRIAEAARKVLSFHYQRMVLNEQGTILGQDDEKLHDMRVAIRRMRVAILVFEIPILDKKILRKTANVLGDVRDLDVFMEKTRVYMETIPESEHSKLTPLLVEWSKLRNTARKRMLTYLDGEDYHRIKQGLIRFSEQATFSNKLESTPIGDVALQLIEIRLNRVLETGKNWFDPTVRQLHMLRIAFKKLRYAIEFFIDVLNADGYSRCIELLKDIQDCLGDIHDSWTAITFVSDFLEDFPNVLEHQDQRSAITDYLSWRQLEMSELKIGFSKLWEQFVVSDFKNNLVLNAY